MSETQGTHENTGLNGVPDRPRSGREPNEALSWLGILAIAGLAVGLIIMIASAVIQAQSLTSLDGNNSDAPGIAAWQAIGGYALTAGIIALVAWLLGHAIINQLRHNNGDA